MQRSATQLMSSRGYEVIKTCVNDDEDHAQEEVDDA